VEPEDHWFWQKEFTAPAWQGWWGMLKTPFVNLTSESAATATENPEPVAEESEDSAPVSRM